MANNILDSIDTRRLGELLQQARKKCGMNQADAARAIDVAPATIVAIEKGERRLRASELIALARAYGRSVSDFVVPRPEIKPFQLQFRAAYQRREEEEAEVEPVVTQLEELCLTVEALDRGLITEGHFADFLRVDRLGARRIAEVVRERSSGIMEEDADLDLCLG